MRANLSRLVAFVRLGRPAFLIGGLVFHALGVVMALYTGHPLNVPALILTQVAISAAQLMTHYANDTFDLAHDRANTTPTFWSGGSRVLPDGDLPPQVALKAALILMGIALAAVGVIAIVLTPSWVAIAVLLAGIGLGWFYSAPPIRLVGRGLGELTAAVVVPGLTTLAGLTLQGGQIDARAGLIILPFACLQIAMLLGVEFPDLESDAETGKRTLAVRLGGEKAALLHTLLLVLGYQAMVVGLILLIARGDFALGLALLAIWLVTLPFGLWHGSRVALGAWCDPLQYSSVAFWGIALLIGTAGLEVIAFVWLAIQRGASLPFL